MFSKRPMWRDRWSLIFLVLGLVSISYLLKKQQVSITPTSRSNTGHVLHTPQTDVIHIVVVACRGKSLEIVNEAATMIKSAIVFSKTKLNIHIFTENLEDEFRKKFSEWPLSAKINIRLTFHRLSYPLDSNELKLMKNWWGPCASFRLFLPTVLENIDSILYVDSDVLFLSPPEDLWNHFNLFDQRQVAALAPRVGWNFQVPPENVNFIHMRDGKKTQVNSGVFLMNLTRMRQPVFATDPDISKRKTSWQKELLFPLYRLHKEYMIGDQNLINVVFHFNPDLLYFLPCKFNYHHKFCFDAYRDRWCTSAENDGAAVIHGNANTFYNNYAPTFRVINDAMKKYNFERDLERFLMLPMERGLSDPNVENHVHCGNKTKLFLKSIRKMVARKTV